MGDTFRWPASLPAPDYNHGGAEGVSVVRDQWRSVERYKSLRADLTSLTPATYTSADNNNSR